MNFELHAVAKEDGHEKGRVHQGSWSTGLEARAALCKPIYTDFFLVLIEVQKIKRKKKEQVKEMTHKTGKQSKKTKTQTKTKQQKKTNQNN